MGGSAGKRWLLAGLIVVVCSVVFAVHFPALKAKAISFDDYQYLVGNKVVKEPSWSSAGKFLGEVLAPSTVGGYYQPLTMISLMVDYAVSGSVDNLVPFHVTSLLLHAANTGLIIVILYMLFGSVWAVAAVGLLFGLHPMTVEPIPWIGERKTLLAAFFSFWCVVSYVFYARKKNWKFYAGCVLFYVLALMSKPTSTPLPAMFLVMDFWPLRRKINWGLVWEKVPLFFIAAVSAVVTYISQTETCGTGLASGYGVSRIPLLICYNIIFYPFKMLWPIGLSSHYALPEPFDLSHPMVLFTVIGTVVLLPVLVISLRRTRAAAAGFVVFLLGISPTVQVIRFSNVIASDKFTYLPCIGLLMVLCTFLVWLFKGEGVKRFAVKKLIVVVLVLLAAGGEAVGTRRYLVSWRDTESLFRHMVKLAPDAGSLRHHLGCELRDQGRVDEAVECFRKSIGLEYLNVRVYYDLGVALHMQEKYDEALLWFGKVVGADAEKGRVAHNNMGDICFTQGRVDEAIGHYYEGLKAKGLPSDLLIEDPPYARTYRYLGDALVMKGRFGEAVEAYEQGVELEGDDVELLAGLGKAYKKVGRMNEARECFVRAVELQPGHLDAVRGAVWFYVMNPDEGRRDANKAVAVAERAVEFSKESDAEILDVLAVAYASVNKFNSAIEASEKALALAKKNGDAELAGKISRRLSQFKSRNQRQ